MYKFNQWMPPRFPINKCEDAENKQEMRKEGGEGENGCDERSHGNY